MSPEQNLRDLKIGYRAKFIKRLSHDFAEGKIDEQKLRELDQESAKKELPKLYGVGPETAALPLEVCHQCQYFSTISRLMATKNIFPTFIKTFGFYGKIRDDIKKAVW